MASLFFFNFRLSPWEGCLNLNFDQEALAPDFFVVCTRDHLGILWHGDPGRHDTASAQAHALARALVHAEAFLSYPAGIVLDVEPVTWLEVPNLVQLDRVVSGYMHQSQARVPLDSNHPDKERLRKAAALVRSLTNVVALQLAYADFYTARRQVGPYSAFYAYRVLEDVGFHFGVTQDGHPNWNAMNSALGTSKEKWDPLTKAGTIARHLNSKALEELATMDRGEQLRLAHEALELALAKIL
jgi:hypothetical protein